jgi:PAS domain S-box-containing protein
MTTAPICLVYQETLLPAVLIRWGASCALLSLWCAPLCAIAQDTAGNTENRSVYAERVRQVPLDSGTITLPVIEGTDIRFESLSSTNRLSQTKISRIVQDDQGFMWFATLYGLYRFDGYDFRVFVHDPENPNSLSGMDVEALFKDRKGALWIACDQFLNKFDLVTGKFTRYPIPFVTHISQDTHGTLWLATPTEGLYGLDPATGQIGHYLRDPNNASTLSSNHVVYSGEDNEGRFWVATTGWLDELDRSTGKVNRHIPVPDAPFGFGFYEDRFGVFWIFHVAPHPLSVLDRNTNTLTHYVFPKEGPTGTTVTRVTAMLEDRNGTLWVTTHGLGLLKFDREHGRFIRYRNDPSDPDSIPQNNADELFADQEGSIWVGLGSMGPVRFSISPLPFIRYVYSPAGLNTRNPFVGAIYEDRQGIMWVGTPKALNRIDRAGSITAYQNGAPETDTDVIAICEDISGFLWVGTYGHGLLRFDRRTGHFKTYRHNPADPHSLSDDFVSRLLIDHNGVLWAATQDGLNRFNPATEGFTSYKLGSHGRLPYLEMVEDREGILWLGTDSRGLQQFDPVTGQLRVYEHDINRPGTLSNNRVNSVHVDRMGTMWVGTQDGLNKLDRRTGTFTTYTQRDGLPGHAVSCILEDGRGDLWMSTNDGVARFDPQRKTFQDYSTADGLPGPDLTGWGACHKSSTGEMFFGGFSGATAFFPDKVTASMYTPPIVLTDFRLFGTGVAPETGSPLEKTINFTNAVTLSHKQNIFSIKFSALSYFNPATNRYRYMLEGLDQHWNEVGGDQRFASYTTLPVGIYTFRVQGATSRGPWTEPGAQLRIEVLPPWWATWWFRTLCIALSVALLAGLYRLRIQHLRREEEHLREVVETIPAMAFTAGPDGSHEFASRRWMEFTGSAEKAILGFGRTLAVHPDDLEPHLTKWRASLKTGVPFENEARHCDSRGVYRWFLVRALPLRDQHGTILKWYGILTDIEDRKSAEERLQELRTKMSQTSRTSMGTEISASIAHEINQPLTSILSNAQACSRWLGLAPPNVDEAATSVGRIVRDARATDSVMRNIYSLFKRQPILKASCNMVDLVQDAVSLIKEDVNRRFIPIEYDYQEPVLMVLVERFQIQQVIMNLVGNAIEAMQVSERPPLLRIHVRQTTDHQVLTEFIDNGCGLSVHDVDNIFDAFVTTKKNGMGIGLAISRSIVEGHDGRLWAENNPDFGARFSLLLSSPDRTIASD